MRQTVTQLPEILFIQVQKTVKPRANEDFFHIQGVWFEIIGIVDHLGDQIDTGHYITWAKHGQAWFKIDDKIVEPDLADAHFSSNNYIFVGIRRNKEDDDKERCIPCGKLFSSHLKHLQQAQNCLKYIELVIDIEYW